MAIAECAAKLAGDEKPIGQGTEWAERGGVLNLVAQQGAVDRDTRKIRSCLAFDTVAVVPVGEWTAQLPVAEMIVPSELGDLGFPWNTDG